MNFKSLIDFLYKLFTVTPETGCLMETPSTIAALPDHAIFGSAPGAKPQRDWSQLCPPFRWQGASLMCTAYAGATVAYILERAENGGSPLFSPLELFFRSGGTIFGNYVSRIFKSLQESVVLETDVPTPVCDSWGYTKFWQLGTHAKANANQIENGKRYALKSMASVNTDRASLRAALQDSPLSVVVRVGRGYFSTIAPSSAGLDGPLHNAVLVKIETDGRLLIADSIEDNSSFTGLHYLAADFPIISAFSFIDLPDNWRDVQKEPIKTYFLAVPKTGEIVPFRSNTSVDYQMFLKAGYKPLN